MIAGQSEIYIYKHINDLVKFSLIIIYSVLRHKFKLFSVVVYAENTRRNAFFLPGFLGSWWRLKRVFEHRRSESGHGVIIWLQAIKSNLLIINLLIVVYIDAFRASCQKLQTPSTFFKGGRFWSFVVNM